MARLFYHVMQDNAGNLLFDVSGTMRLAGTGTAATIYGDEALTVILPNPMTNHPSYGSFKCYLGPGSYDFYMAKAGYTFETLTGVQGGGTLAGQDADDVTITGGRAILTEGLDVPDGAAGPFAAVFTHVAAGTDRYNYYSDGTAPSYLAGMLQVVGGVGLGGRAPGPGPLEIRYLRASQNGIILVPDADAGGSALLFHNAAVSAVGSIVTSSTTTTYNTTSDSRLKEFIETLVGALDVVRALRPVSFRWQADGSQGHGFLANEVEDVIPDGVITGDKDAVEEDGTIRPQMIDMSKLVPWLVGAVQTLANQVETLTERVTELENSLGL
jgi:hypothetical protein